MFASIYLVFMLMSDYTDIDDADNDRSYGNKNNKGHRNTSLILFFVLRMIIQFYRFYRGCSVRKVCVDSTSLFYHLLKQVLYDLHGE